MGDPSVLVDDQHIAVPPAGQQAVLDPGGGAKLLDQKQSANQKHQNDDNRGKAGGLPLGRLLALPVILPLVMSIHRALHRSLGSFSASVNAMEARQHMVA
jgi:hypothetical protein